MTGFNKLHAANCACWALGHRQANGFKVRRIVWGLLMAQAEARNGEEIRAATILVERTLRHRASILPRMPKPGSREEPDPADEYAQAFDNKCSAARVKL